MPNLSWNEIQDRATEFAAKWAGETYEKGESQSFWSDFLNVYGIDRRRHGAFFEYAIKKGSGKQGFIDMFWPGKLLAEQKSGGKDLGAAGVQAYEYLETMPDHDLPQAIVVSDFATFKIRDLEIRDEIEFSLADFPKHVKLFAFLIDQTSKKTAEEQPVNRKAAEAMARLHNQLRDDNYTGHDLELLLVRLVFCMFADDSGIFEHAQLHDYLVNRTSEGGSDLGNRLVQLFEVLNTPRDARQHSLDDDLLAFEYINGGLFAEQIRTPSFTAQMRRDLLAAMELNWSQVSPAIFGSMFQGVMDEEQRRNLGAHYTSEKNILRVIKPLFLDQLYEEFASVRRSPKKLAEFHDKLAHLKFLDPACGCGNFLVITYRELRRLEHKVIEQLNKGNKTIDWLATSEHGQLKVNVDQMYGIEIEEFPSLIAQTALWLTDHQMNMEFSTLSGKTFKRLPLTTSATIVHDNALTKDWAEVVAPSELNCILGNPPFLGYKNQQPEQKEVLQSIFKPVAGGNVLDMVAAWYIKATQYIQQNPNVHVGFVSTNSITQGEQSPLLWRYVFSLGAHINFAHTTFRWANDAKGNAGVYCVIIGFSLLNNPGKTLFHYPSVNEEPIETAARNINGYLVDAPTLFIEKRSKPIQSSSPIMNYGSEPREGGFLIFSDEEKQVILAQEPSLEKYIKRFTSADDYINNIQRWCFWLKDTGPGDLRSSAILRDRLTRIRAFREVSKQKQAHEAANRPSEFVSIRQPKTQFLLIPIVSSERREYIPIGYEQPDVIVSNACFTLSDASLYDFAILTSNMHMSWVNAVCGRLESRYRYSNTIVYNNFIWPEASAEQKVDIEKLAQSILDARAKFPDSSLADLYDPLTMPPELSKAHKALDKAIDKLYQSKPFESDAERVALLFEKYQETTNDSKN